MKISMKISRFFIYVIIIDLILILGLIGHRTYKLSTDEHYHGWPTMTNCRICDKTVWEWQNYSRRQFNVETDIKNDSSNIIGISVNMSGLVHDNCEGIPTTKIEINLN